MAAVDEFFIHRRSNPLSDENPISYETDVLAVSYVPDFLQSRYGFHFKDTDEFGLYTLFVDDNDKTYLGFYRSDREFEAEIILHYLHIDEHI
jgi:hypothetical protein